MTKMLHGFLTLLLAGVVASPALALPDERKESASDQGYKSYSTERTDDESSKIEMVRGGGHGHWGGYGHWGGHGHGYRGGEHGYWGGGRGHWGGEHGYWGGGRGHWGGEHGHGDED